MKRTFKLDELCCANCAAKMEDAINRIEGVKSAGISFMTQRLTLEAEDADFEGVLKEADRAIRRIERDCRIIM